MATIFRTPIRCAPAGGAACTAIGASYARSDIEAAWLPGARHDVAGVTLVADSEGKGFCRSFGAAMDRYPPTADHGRVGDLQTAFIHLTRIMAATTLYDALDAENGR
ncbi:hypothetical protein [Streptomyces sp. enrichment culture]|uniref:hypothetical protein n=1 Tax=Streptomyces sp. enrichment culture TaxID=1795815 RepID=UPI003F569E8D